MAEKIFFVDKIETNAYDAIFDFGCANGALIHMIQPYFSRDAKFLGYDKINTFLEEGRRLNEKNNNVCFTDDINSFINEIKKHDKTLVIFSSVIHEFSEQDMQNMFKITDITSTVAIRDMFFDDSVEIHKYDKKFLEAFNKSDLITKEQITEFESVHGKLDNLKAFYHMFLKYTYKDNWPREVMENYFSGDWKRIDSTLQKQGYNIIHDDIHTLPFKKQEIAENFGITLEHPTHRSAVYDKE